MIFTLLVSPRVFSKDTEKKKASFPEDDAPMEFRPKNYPGEPPHSIGWATTIRSRFFGQAIKP